MGYGAAATLAEEPAVDLGGQPLPGGTGSTNTADPTELTAGLWSDTLGPPQSGTGVHNFVYDRTMADSTVHVGVIGASLAESSDGVDIAVTDPAGEDCGTDGATPTYPVVHGTFGAAVAVGPDEPGETGSVCANASTLRITVTRGLAAEDTDLPIAIKVVEEGPATGVGDLPPAEEEPTYERVGSDAEPEQVDSATSFDDAPVLEASPDGVVVSTEVNEGEERLFRVPVTWGQRVSVDAVVPVQDAEDAAVLQFVEPTVDLSIVDPARNSFQDVVDETEPSGYYDTDEVTRLSVGTPPVRYLNRFEDQVAALPGDYWLAIAVPAAPADRDAVSVPVELTLAVTGTAEGAPTYQKAVLAPDGNAGPDGYSPEKPFLVGDGKFSAVASGNPAPAPAATEEGWFGPRRLAGIGLAAVSAACIAAGLWQIARRRA